MQKRKINNNNVMSSVTWPLVDPQFVLDELHKFEFGDGLKFYKSYKLWNSLNRDQQNKVCILTEFVNHTIHTYVTGPSICVQDSRCYDFCKN